MSALLTVRDLSVDYRVGKEIHPAVNGVSFDLKKGETLGFVGESGCGKSTIALSVMGLLPREEGHLREGEIIYDDKKLTGFSEKKWRRIRGREIAMIFQDPFSSLNPVMTVREQLLEVASKKKASQWLEHVQLHDAERILGSYPHQLSGGQRQRVMIAMALAREPKILIADEPTTALDVTVQKEIIDLLKKLQRELRMSMIFVTHNIGLIKDVADELAVMLDGKIVEIGPTDNVLSRPKHEYTKALLKSIPRIKC
jgi:ABC-type dipeptide/oligopeptide/nickel transport system ATPase component